MSVQNEMKNVKARCSAFGVGIYLEQIEGGFHLYKAIDDEQLGYDDSPWTAEEVIDYCQKFKEYLLTGIQ